MRFLVDEQLPPGLCSWLAARGHEAEHVTKRGNAQTDAAIAEWAEQEGLILISKDEDFLALRLPNRFAFVWVRCGNVTNKAMSSWLGARWPQASLLLEGGERIIELV